jgi:hypothetical protein
MDGISGITEDQLIALPDYVVTDDNGIGAQRIRSMPVRASINCPTLVRSVAEAV